MKSKYHCCPSDSSPKQWPPSLLICAATIWLVSPSSARFAITFPFIPTSLSLRLHANLQIANRRHKLFLRFSLADLITWFVPSTCTLLARLSPAHHGILFLSSEQPPRKLRARHRRSAAGPPLCNIVQNFVAKACSVKVISYLDHEISSAQASSRQRS